MLEDGEIAPLIRVIQNLEINDVSARYVIGFLHGQFMEAVQDGHLSEPEAMVLWLGFTDYYMRVPDPDAVIVSELFLRYGAGRTTQISAGVPRPFAVLRTARTMWRRILDEHMGRDELHPGQAEDFRPWLHRLLILARERDNTITDRIPNIDKWIELLEDPETMLDEFFAIEDLQFLE